MTKNKPPAETLHRLYWDEEKSLKMMGRMFDVDGATVRNWMISYDISRRNLSKGKKRSKTHGKRISEAQKRLVTEGKRRYDGEHSPAWKGGPATVNCGWCGTELQMPKARVKRQERFFCKGTDCRSQWMSIAMRKRRYDKPHYGSQELECDNCGKMFRRKNSRVKNKERKYQFCSRKCKQDFMRGDKIYNYKGGYDHYYGPNWYEQRRKARERDNYICQHCGIHQPELDRALDVHHIIPFSEFGLENYIQANDLQNLISLCQSCHSSVTANSHKAKASYTSS